MFKASSIKPLSDFVRHTKSHIEALRKSGDAEVLTVNGEAAVVVQDAKSYEKMMLLAQQAEQDSRLQAALEYFREGGEGIKAKDVFATFDERYK